MKVINENDELTEVESTQLEKVNDQSEKTLGIYHDDIIPAVIAGAGVFYLIGSRKLPIGTLISKLLK